VRSEGSLTLPLDLWTPQAFHQQDERAYFILALYFGMLLALALYNLLLYFSLREPSYLAYVLFAGAMALAQLSQNGLGNEFIWPQWTAWGNVALPCGYAATGFFGALFTRLFLDTARWSRWLDRMIVAHMTVFAIAAVSPAFAPYQAAAILTSLTGVSFAFVAVAGGVFCLRRGHPGARYFLWAWTLLLIGVAVMGLRNLGWVPTTLGSTHAIQIGSSLEMLLLSFALASRIHNERRDRERAQAEALLAAQRLERELEHKVGRRTEQLLAANARLGEAMVELAEIAATDRLTGAWNRRRLEEVATGEIERARRHGDALSLIMFDVDHFKGINDRSGHAVGDAVLEDLVAVVRTNVRASDSITRWGGEEFVVLTPATDLTGATRLAEKLRRCIAVHTFTKSHKVTVSLGVSTLLPDDDSLAQLIARADEALYRAKGEGRNRTITATEFEARRREAVVAR
jgi:diguanylate cyclase (GGDEF)-like protein